MTPMLRQEANATIRRVLLRAILLPIVLMAVLAGSFFWLITSLQDATNWVEHTDQAIAQANQVQSTILDQETGLRGYLLTDEQTFLEPYTRAILKIGPQLDTFAQLVRDNPTQVARIATLRAENSLWQTWAADTLARKASSGDFVSSVRNGEGKRHVDRMRAINAQIIAEEATLRAERVAKARTTTNIVVTSSILAALLLGGMLALATRRTLNHVSQTYNTALRAAERNEQDLYTQRELFRNTLASIGDAVIATDAQGKINFMNQVAATLTGWTFDTAQSKPLGDVFTIINEQTREPAEVPVERVLRDGAVVGLANHTALVRHDGTIVPIDDSAAPVRDSRGALVGAVLVFRDISERYRAETNLRTSELRYRELAEAMPMLVWTADRMGKITYRNQRWFDYTGADLEALDRPNRMQLLHPDDIDLTLKIWSEALRTGQPFDYEYRLRRADGAYRWQLGRGVPQHDEHGQLTQWIGTAADIDDQKRVEEQIRASEAQFRNLAESMPQLVWKTNAAGYHEYFNQRWYDFTGTTLEQVRGEGWSNFLHPDDYDRTIDVWTHALRTGAHYDIEYRFKEASTGEYRWFLGRADAVRDSDGRITQWVGTCTDVNSQKHAEEALRERTETLALTTSALEERNRELDQFAYVTSHDLKAPLRGIANLSQWIEEDLGDHATADIRKQMELLRGRVHRMEALIDGILQYSRIGRVKGDIEQVDVGALVDDVADLLAPPPTMTITVQPGMPSARTARLDLQQVLQNLLNNAIKHGQRLDLQITVGWRDAGQFYEFSVGDNGPGIAPQYHERVFVIFQTLAARDKVEGTGLGLSLVKKIVEYYGGRIWLESSEGQGATFRFTWPK